MRLRPPSIGPSLSGIWYRRALSVMILVIAAAGAAAAAMGVAYEEAGRTAVIRDSLRDAPREGHELLFTGPGWPESPTPDSVLRERVRGLFDRVGGSEFFGEPIVGIEFANSLHPLSGDKEGRFNLIARDDICDHIRITAGRCPQAPGEVMVSVATAAELEWELDDTVLLESLVEPEPSPAEEDEAPSDAEDAEPQTVPIPLPIVGFYEVIDRTSDYWAGKGKQYFPDEAGREFAARGAEPGYEALITSFGTFGRRPQPFDAGTTGNGYVTVPLNVDAVHGDNADDLLTVVTELRRTLAEERVRRVPSFRVVITDLDRVVTDARNEQSAFSAPAVLVTLQVVALTWVLLVVLVNTLVEARAAEVGLARLRGLSWWAVRRFAVGEIVVLIALAVPLGVVAGVAAARPLAARLGGGIPVDATPLTILAAASTAAGGLAAALVAAQRTMTRAVAEQWRSSAARPRRRSWVLDLVLVALAAAGFVELTTGGVLGAASEHSTLTLLAPGLFALASAVLVARLLPLMARGLLGITRRHGGVGTFLAVRRIARGIGTATTLVVLITSLGLVTFAAAAWSSARANHRDVAMTHLGADTVLTVAAPDARTVAEAVRQIDPGGTKAVFAAVLLSERAQGATLIGVDPQRFAQVAYWRDDFAAEPVGDLMAQLNAPLPPRMMVSGDRLRITYALYEAPAGTSYRLVAEVETPGSTSLVRVIMGEAVQPGEDPVVAEARLPACPDDGCELRGITVEFGELEPGSNPALTAVEVLVTEIAVRTPSGWQVVDAGLTESGRWRTLAGGEASALPTPDGLVIRFLPLENVRAEPATYPIPVKALTTGGTQPDPFGVSVVGLDERSLPILPAARTRALPGVSSAGLIVSHEVLDRVAIGVSGDVDYEVWCAPGAAATVRAGLEASGLAVTDERTAADLAERFGAEGPGLALRLLLAIAVAAALLATGATVIELHASSRRRRYELAALRAAGASRRSLRASLLIEHAVILGTAAVVGPAAGLAASTVVVSRIPTFAVTPSTPPLRYPIELSVLLMTVGAAFVLAAVAVVVMTVSIVRGTRADQLREAGD